MQMILHSIPLHEALHFMGWRGTPVEPELAEQIRKACAQALEVIRPRVISRRFAIGENGSLSGCAFAVQGQDAGRMLASCHEAVLLAATLGAESERLLLREQARSSAQAVVMDAVLSAAVEAACDQAENNLREQLSAQGLYLTDRFSPGYGDMPLSQSREICEVLSCARTIGLTVSQSGIMIPRKSVTAVMGISRTPVARRPSGCEVCAMRGTCAYARKKAQYNI